MPKLTYDLSVRGAANVKQSLQSVERSFQQHARRMEKAASKVKPGGRAQERAFDSFAQKESAHERRMQQIRLKGIRDIELARERGRRRGIRDFERQQLAAAKRVEAQRAKFRSAVSGGIVRGTGSALRGIGRVAGGALAIGGGLAATQSIRERLSLNAQATDLANQAYGNTGEIRSREAIRQDVLRQTEALDKSSGIGQDNLVRGLRAFTTISGDLSGGQALLPFMADLADASGADVGDVGRATAQAKQAVALSGIEDPVKQVEETKKIMAALAKQSKLGSIEMADMATQMGKLTSSAGRFEGGASDLIETMGALGQMALAGGAASPDEAMTALMRFSDDLVKNSDRFKKQGVSIWADKGKTKLKGPEDILLQVLGKTGGNLEKIKKLFGVRSAKAVEPLLKTFNESEAKKKGSGLDAVRAQIAKFSGGLSDKDIREGAAFKRKQDDRQIKAAFDEFKRAMGKELVPVLQELTPKFKELVPHIGKIAEMFASFVTWFAKNPISGIGAIIAASVAKEIAGAAIGKVAGSALEKAIGTATSSSKGVTLGAGAGAAIGASILAGFALYVANDQVSKLEKETGGSLWGLLPGFDHKGNFDSERMLKAINPVTAIATAPERIEKTGRVLTDIFTDSDENLTATKRRAAEDLALSQSTLYKGYKSAGMSDETAQKQSHEAVAKIAQDAYGKSAKELITAAQEITKAAGGLGKVNNRSDGTNIGNNGR